MLQEIVIASLLLMTIIVLLSLGVLAARKIMGVGGTVIVTVSHQRQIEARSGQRLLSALAEAGIFLPSACGGKGTCGECRVRIEAHCPEILPIESEHIDMADAASGVRLACVVRIRDPLQVSFESESLAAGHWDCEIVSSRFLSAYLKELILRLPADDRLVFDAGDYIQVEVPGHQLDFKDIEVSGSIDLEWKRLGLKRLKSSVNEPVVRSYSLANPPQQDREIRLVVKLALPPAHAPAGTPPGRASSYLFSLAPGDQLAVRGPFGTFNATDNDCEMIMIAGGAGIAPIRSILLDQLSRRTMRKISLWFGARTRSDLCYLEELECLAREHDHFELHPVLSEPAAGDHWNGATGFVHAVLYEQYLESHHDPGDAEYYLCGPPVMADAVLQMLEGLGVERNRIFLDDFET
ncbi:MAG: NADH:ubiquinone reductase (Na(+)-transporting) subunit F [Xanthomonadales bacterium]|nr:NADH:ubiquinone reductase (Na(+)-transporting) subunit F [Gammaproteobacteria bacterium]NNL94323.1 NADH:ubiquinone reductase (Na(+)-transporting) subunit F [Xanthomonadales bacterium]